ncbi:alanine--glyoxylate aminotransferase 2, mitochondrial isoform X2 [Cherax quadricarinatus]|uniref:alanine--glyoxylate aminotransferase 2, mitochondrial isoform X2 n=1 Tax=Cherax quadricarinatus TaxID=27406 RepID=UPI00387EBDA3
MGPGTGRLRSQTLRREGAKAGPPLGHGPGRENTGKSTNRWRRSLWTQVPSMPACEYLCPTYKGPDYDEVVKLKGTFLNPVLVTHFSQPLLIHDGHMQWLFDHTGKRYLDLFGGIVTVSVGHCHPKVLAAATEQLNKLWHTTNIYLHPKIHEYAQRLAEKLPADLNVVYFVNSGSEANDLAMMMARLYTGNFDIISLRNSYHGASPYTAGLTAQGTWKYNFANGFGIHNAINPDPYRGLWGGHRDSPVQSVRSNESEVVDGVCSSTQKYIDQLQEVLMYSLPKGKLAAFFAESIQGVGGTVQYPLGYLKKAFELVRSHGGLCVSDEVQTGFGRTGEHFWGFEGHGVVPDIVTMAKGMGNGFPIAAVVTTSAVAKTMSQALHFNTFGGNPVASAVGVSVLEDSTSSFPITVSQDSISSFTITVSQDSTSSFTITVSQDSTSSFTITVSQDSTISPTFTDYQDITSSLTVCDYMVLEEEKTQEKALEVGTYFLHSLAKLREEYPVVGDVRGKGLMIGMEMVQDSTSRTPLSPHLMMQIWDTCKDHGVLLGKGGFHGNVFRIKPPMCINRDDVDFTVTVLRQALQPTNLL